MYIKQDLSHKIEIGPVLIFEKPCMLKRLIEKDRQNKYVFNKQGYINLMYIAH